MFPDGRDPGNQLENAKYTAQIEEHVRHDYPLRAAPKS